MTSVCCLGDKHSCIHKEAGILILNSLVVTNCCFIFVICDSLDTTVYHTHNMNFHFAVYTNWPIRICGVFTSSNCNRVKVNLSSCLHLVVCVADVTNTLYINVTKQLHLQAWLRSKWRGGGGRPGRFYHASPFLPTIPTCIERRDFLEFSDSVQSKVANKKNLKMKTFARKKILLISQKENINSKCISLLVLFYRFTKYQTNLLLSSSSSISSGNADIYWIWASVPEQPHGARLSLPAAHEDTLRLQTWRPPSETTWITLSQLVRWIGTPVS